MKSINPSFKFIGILAPTIFLALYYRPFMNLAVFGVCLLLLLLSQIEMVKIAKFLAPIMVAAIGMFFTGYYYGSDASQTLNQQFMANDDIYNGLQLSSRVLAFAGLGILFILTTDKIEFVRSLEQQCRLPAKFAYGLMAAWGIMPNIRLEYMRTRAAFYARGLYPLAFSPSLLIPLFVKAVRWSEALSAAMESKGFDESSCRTRYYELKPSVKDYLFVVIFCASMVCGVVLFDKYVDMLTAHKLL